MRAGLTPATTGRNLRGKERKNSERSGIRARQTSRFFCARALLRREGDGYNTRKGKKSRRLRSVFSLPASQRVRLKTSPLGFNNLTQERFMARTTTAAKAAKPRAAKQAAPTTNVIPFPADARERRRRRSRIGDDQRRAAFALAKDMGFTMVPPAAKDVMQYLLMLNEDSRDTLLVLAKSLYANKDNRWPMYR